MKKLLFSLIIFLVWQSNFAFSQNSSPALTYMNELNKPLNDLKEETWQYLKALTTGKGAKTVDKKRQALIEKTKVTKTQIEAKEAFNGDEGLKNAIVGYIGMSYTVLKEDYDKILDMEEIAEQSYDLMEAYLLAKEKAGEKLDASFDVVVAEQKTFAEKNNITLVEGEADKTTQKIKKASEVLKYYNELFLIFFKPFKQEAYVLDAIQRNDISAVEQNTSSLVSISNATLETLKSAKSYKGDASLTSQAKNIVTFYKKEAEVDFPKIIEFYMKRDKMEKVGKAFEAKSQKNRTQKDVDEYNAVVNDYNKSLQSYNQTVESINKQRDEKYKQWTLKINEFFEKYSK